LCVHTKDSNSGVGYRLIGLVDNYMGARVGKDRAPSGEGGTMTCRDRRFVTDEDENIRVLSGRRHLGLFPFRDEVFMGEVQVDEYVRGFLGVIEYELDE
jgi:hypothetical protein